MVRGASSFRQQDVTRAYMALVALGGGPRVSNSAPGVDGIWDSEQLTFLCGVSRLDFFELASPAHVFSGDADLRLLVLLGERPWRNI